MIKQKISSGAIYFDEKRTGDTMHISTNAFKPAVYAPLSVYLYRIFWQMLHLKYHILLLEDQSDLGLCVGFSNRCSSDKAYIFPS